MRKLLLILMTVGIITSCQSSESQKNSTSTPTNFHKVTVQEVLQTTNYTYLHAKENDSVIWLALPLMQAQVGEIYYYENPMLMTNFQSKELNRSFETVYFIASVSKEPVSIKPQATGQVQQPANPEVENVIPAEAEAKRSLDEPHDVPKTQVEQESNIKVQPAKGGITIAKLYSKKDTYAGKSVIIRGQVTKVNMGIMNHNWIHIQDGTSLEKNFDLTVTTDSESKIGDIVTFEGKITLNKDFGYGYFYEVIMEDAVKK